MSERSSRNDRPDHNRGRRPQNNSARRAPVRNDERNAPSAHRVSPARMVAYDVLRDVEDRDAYANLALPARIRDARLNTRDAALATELVAGTLRGQGRYDRIIEIAADRYIADVDPRTRNVLRLGAHQLLSMRIAAHAAVHECVEMQRIVANPGGAGFVNGVLRSIDRSTNEEWDEQIRVTAPNADAALAVKTSHPAWILRAFRSALRSEGREDELETLLDSDNRAPRVNMVLLPGSGIDIETAEAIGAEDGVIGEGPSPLGLVLEQGDPGRVIAGLDLPDGTIRVQDQGSQLAALALARARNVEVGERWLDLCAGPGGKTAVLAAEARLGGASVRAVELAEHRSELVRSSVVANSDIVEVVTFDGRSDAAFGAEHFDRILVDAPCSGLGALRRRPEARWRKQPSDLPELNKLQGELLDAAAIHLQPGGLLAYVTCSPHLTETRVVVQDMLKRHPELRELNAKHVLNSVAREPLDLAGDQLSAQLWPHRNGTDAMFIALFERTATLIE